METALSAVETERDAAEAERAHALAAVRSDVFSWSEDQIGEWVSEAEMRALLEGLSMRYAGAPLPGDVVFEVVDSVDSEDTRGFFDDDESPVTGPEMIWAAGPVGDATSWVVHVHDGAHTREFEGDVSVLETTTPGMLPHGVAWATGYGVYTLRGPNSDEIFCISLETTITPVGTWLADRPCDDVYEELVFKVASMILGELAWAD